MCYEMQKSPEISFPLNFEVGGLGSRSSSSQRRMFYKYCCCGWGAPLVVVGVCVALDRTISDTIGYGEALQLSDWQFDIHTLSYYKLVSVSYRLSKSRHLI